METPPADATVDASSGAWWFTTDHGGLFYLAGRVLEIDLAGHLYFAGIFEGDFLTRVARLLIDDPDDPAPRLFGGVLDGEDPPLAPVADWAADEVWLKTRRSLAAWMHERKWPCPLDDELVEILDALAAPLVAAARAGANPITATLLGRSAALLAYTFAARLGQPVDLPSLRAYLMVPGRVELQPDALRVVMPMESIDLTLRLAGLDFNPGWLPWMRRKLTLEFARTDGGSDEE